jgi:hypothetical protein
MRINASLGRNVRSFIKVLFALGEPAPGPAPSKDALFLQFGFGAPLNPSEPNPEEFEIMAKGNVGQRVPLVVKALKADGTPGETAGKPVFDVEDDAVVEVREEDGKFFGYLLAQGGSSITATVPVPSGPDLVAVGLVVVNDPADDATIVELEIGAAEDVASA